MKIRLLLIPMLLLSACRTTAGTKEKPAAAKPYAAESEKLLQRIVGGIIPKAQIFDCTVMSTDLDNLDEVKKLIAEALRDQASINTAYHFRATDPSQEYYAYAGATKFLLSRDESNWQYIAKNNTLHPAARSLMDIANKHCPYPAK
jgi:hypothetical protein